MWSLSVFGSDFNCQDECGLYKKGDDESPAFHNLCEAMDEKRKCKKKYGVKRNRKNKKKRTQRGTRIVGGDETKNPMPWMVKTVVGLVEIFMTCIFRCSSKSLTHNVEAR